MGHLSLLTSNTARKVPRTYWYLLRDPKTLLLGYGATRLPPRFSNFHDSSHRLVRAKNLFNPFEPLSDSIDWLSGLPESDFNRMALALKDLLLLQEQDTLVRSSNELMSVKLESSGISVPFRNLSDGYQSVVALSTDIMGTMSRRWPDMSIAEGIVLIDEIDAHLHPRWKMQIVKRLRQVFPRIQFILTSHDPLCLRGMHKEEVVVMHRSGRNSVEAITDLRDPV